MNFINRLFTLFSMVYMGINFLSAQEMEKIHKEFDAKKELHIKSVSGDYEIRKGSGDKIIVDIEYETVIEKAFEAEFRDSGSKLRIEEIWHGSSSGGKLLFSIQVPDDIEIDFNTASGDLELSGLNLKLEASTASGDLEIKNASGEIEVSAASGDIEITGYKGEIDISTASGDVELKKTIAEIEINTASGDMEIKNSEGAFELSCASGDIEVKQVVITDESSFSTASGSIEISLTESTEYDMELSSASGDIALDYNGNSLRGYFEFSAKKGKGYIDSPYDFDTEEEFERNERTYVKKSFRQGGRTPNIIMSTASGDISLTK